MALRLGVIEKVFRFNFPARTSRGAMREKKSWFIQMQDDSRPGVVGLGECGPLPGLSVDWLSDYKERITALIGSINTAALNIADAASLEEMVPPEYPSMRFGIETALRDLQNGGRRVVFENDFTSGMPIPINGLIWMGDMDFMMTQIDKKVAEGFRCIKLKIGGLDFHRECDVLAYIRRRYHRENIAIRLDANGAFEAEDALQKLHELARFTIHSVEQPIKAGAPEMEALCRKSPIPVAFDEELIGVHLAGEKRSLLTRLRPGFIVLKPMLHGGFRGCEEWIAIAESLQIGWWITSALESSIGLNAICQFTANFRPTLPQGLGTGAIYTNNFASPLNVQEGSIRWDPAADWNLGSLMQAY